MYLKDMKIFPPLGCGAFLALSGMIVPLHAADPVIVHEWGTFTSLQDEQGEAIKGINVDDEPVPSFIYNQGVVPVTAQYSQLERNFGLPPYYIVTSKGWQPDDPDVTMRLETPVIYFYPPKGQTAGSVPLLNVHVDFHGGILSQSYPYATLEGASSGIFGYANQRGVLNTINAVTWKLSSMTSSLTWKNVRLGSTGKPVETDDKVWTTPREVSAPLLEVTAPIYDANGHHDEAQPEHFLFYRGVGHLDSPISLIPNGSGKKGGMEVISHHREEALEKYDDGWMVEIRPDGNCAFRPLHNFMEGMTEGSNVYYSSLVGLSPKSFVSLSPSASFTDHDFSADNLTQLKASMQAALVKEGLYPDEGSAMLRTWELSYFKSPGLRFFYIVPRAWTDKVLPLKITGAPTEITRVMVGRIELITDEQKAALARLATGPCPDLASVKKAAQDALQKSTLPKDEVAAFYRGEKPLSALGIPLPPLVQDYLSLGRFRDALIVHEQQQHPSVALAQFIKDNGLAPMQN
jgi:hypothetical protein